MLALNWFVEDFKYICKIIYIPTYMYIYIHVYTYVLHIYFFNGFLLTSVKLYIEIDFIVTFP
jgi:hypothetical protein